MKRYNLLYMALIAAALVFISCKHSTGAREYGGPYRGDNLSRIAFPVGGIGAGMFCVEGSGIISNLSVRNRPEENNEPGMFAAIHVKNMENGTKVLEGPVPEWRRTGRRGWAQIGASAYGASGANWGLPRYTSCEFSSRFPFAAIDLEDDHIPVDVAVSAWSPFIPTNADDSSLPAGVLEYTFSNRSGEPLEMVFSFNSRNFMTVYRRGSNAILPADKGFVLSQTGTEAEPWHEGQFAVRTDDPAAVVNHCWFRGGWFDPLTMAWNDLKSGKVQAVEPVAGDAPGASLYVPFQLEPGAEKRIRVFLAWYVPETTLRYGGTPADPEDNCADHKYTGEEYPTHRPWYVSKFDGAAAAADYVADGYDRLYGDTRAFTDAFYSSTLPAEVVEAVAANLSILKSPTALRQTDGRMWNWEGSGDEWGSCTGSCTHVWNYAQAVPHLFPSLERSLRETEFGESQNKAGHQTFRSALPIRPVDHNFYAAADGQMGGIMKVYRDWRISGDDAWLKKIYPKVKLSLDYCIATWDPGRKGTIEEPHHNTYDIEFWGSDGMHNSFYAGALTAFVKMGEYLGENVSEYEKLYTACREFTENNLFNGEYFIQNIQWSGLQAADPVKAAQDDPNRWMPQEMFDLLVKEGPKYQYGTGCLSDGVFGAGLARSCGLPEPLDAEKTKSHLLSVHKYNLKKDLTAHDNPQRPGFAYGDEGGLLLCSWPKGGKLSIPFVYSDEVWTGIEYQVASHLMYNGEVEKGLEIVRTCRDRYDGSNRNPFNEVECGNWYARAMASYGMLQALTGVRYDAVEKTLYVDSQVGDFTSFLSTATGFGTVTFKNGKAAVDVAYGDIDIQKTVVVE